MKPGDMFDPALSAYVQWFAEGVLTGARPPFPPTDEQLRAGFGRIAWLEDRERRERIESIRDGSADRMPDMTLEETVAWAGRENEALGLGFPPRLLREYATLAYGQAALRHRPCLFQAARRADGPDEKWRRVRNATAGCKALEGLDADRIERDVSGFADASCRIKV